MAITQDDIIKLAKLANLELTDAEKQSLPSQIASIVEYVEQLNEIDTEGVEPALGGLTPGSLASVVTRSDAVEGSLGQELALDQAPDAQRGHFRVPKVIAAEN